MPKRGEDPEHDALEKALLKTATRGVVRLFNAVSKAQRDQKDALVGGSRSRVGQLLSSAPSCLRCQRVALVPGHSLPCLCKETIQVGVVWAACARTCHIWHLDGRRLSVLLCMTTCHCTTTGKQAGQGKLPGRAKRAGSGKGHIKGHWVCPSCRHRPSNCCPFTPTPSSSRIRLGSTQRLVWTARYSNSCCFV